MVGDITAEDGQARLRDKEQKKKRKKNKQTTTITTKPYVVCLVLVSVREGIQ